MDWIEICDRQMLFEQLGPTFDSSEASRGILLTSRRPVLAECFLASDQRLRSAAGK